MFIQKFLFYFFSHGARISFLSSIGTPGKEIQKNLVARGTGTVFKCLGHRICADKFTSVARVVVERVRHPFPRGVAIWHLSSAKKLFHCHGGHEELPVHIAYWQGLVQLCDLVSLGRWVFFVTFGTYMWTTQGFFFVCLCFVNTFNKV